LGKKITQNPSFWSFCAKKITKTAKIREILQKTSQKSRKLIPFEENFLFTICPKRFTICPSRGK